MPTVIDTGMYIKDDVFTSLEQIELLQKSLESNKLLILENQSLKEERKVLEEDNQAKKQKILQDAPKVYRFQQFMDSDGLFSFSIAAKILCGDSNNIGRNRLFKLLSDNKYIFKDNQGQRGHWEPYQDKSKYFKMKFTTIRRSTGSYEYPQIFITPKGLDHIADKFFSDREAI